MKPHDPKLDANNSGRTNAQRAEKGKHALIYYWGKRPDLVIGDGAQNAAAMLTDALHYVHTGTADPQAAIAQAAADFARETGHEVCTECRTIYEPDSESFDGLCKRCATRIDRIAALERLPDLILTQYGSIDEDDPINGPDAADFIAQELLPTARQLSGPEWKQQLGRAKRQEAGRVTLPKRDPLPALSHAEIVDSFPILRDLRIGFLGTARLEQPGSFYLAAGGISGGAQILAAFVCDLIHGERFSGSRYSLANLFPRIDSEHRAAVLAVLAAVSERGIQ